MFRFHTPLALTLLLLLPIFVPQLQFNRIFKRKTARNNVNPTPALVCSHSVPKSVIPQSWRCKLHSPILIILKSTAFILLVIALARPQIGSHFSETVNTGHDIVLALDISGSMQAMDFFVEDKRVDRLTALKSVVDKFIDERQGDRMALVIFGDHAFTQCPLTQDKEVLKQFIEAIEVGMAGQGTAIGDALGISLKRIINLPAESKVIVLVTDGKSNSGTITPIEAAKLAQETKVKIHTIGIGGNEPAPFPVKDLFGRTHLQLQQMEYDEETLKQIAQVTGGEYFNAKDTNGLIRIYQQIDKLEEREAKSYEHVQYEECFLPWLIWGFILLLTYEIFSTTVFLTVP